MGKFSYLKGIGMELARRHTLFPGGAVERNEEVINGAKRELMEETGYEGKNGFSMALLSGMPANNVVHIIYTLQQT